MRKFQKAIYNLLTVPSLMPDKFSGSFIGADADVYTEHVGALAFSPKDNPIKDFGAFLKHSPAGSCERDWAFEIVGRKNENVRVDWRKGTQSFCVVFTSASNPKPLVLRVSAVKNNNGGFYGDRWDVNAPFVDEHHKGCGAEMTNTLVRKHLRVMLAAIGCTHKVIKRF
jgi:hypothetical protein